MSPRLLGLVAAAALAAPASAQPTLDLTVGGSIQSVATPAFAATDTRSSLVGGAGAGLDFGPGGRAHVGYVLDAGTYASPGDWSYRQHRADGLGRIDLSAGTRLHVGVAGTLRRNGEAWAEADYGAIAAFANLEARPRAGLTLRAGYRVDRREFDAMPSLDQTEHGAFASLLVNLPSRTTLIGEARAGVKGYRGDPLVAGAEPTAADETVPATTQGGGDGRGRGRGAGSGAMGPSTRPSTTPPASAALADHAQQVTVLGRLAQSVGERTGLSFQVTWRATGGSVPPAVVTTPAGFFDDGVYDDPYASGLLAGDVRLKHVRPGGAVLEVSARRFVQSYTAAVALGADGLPLPGDPLREDRVWRAGASIDVPLAASHTGAFDLRLHVAYGWTHSASNDAFYDYRNHVGGAALSVGY